MAKNKKVVEEQTNDLGNEVIVNSEVVNAPAAEAPAPEAPAPEAPAPEAPAPEVIPDTPEVAAKKLLIVDAEKAVEIESEALKAAKKALRTLQKELEAMLKGEPVKSSKEYVFISLGKDPKEIKMANGKPLSYQAQLLVTMFIGDAPEGTKISVSKDEIMKKLEETYPCVGDKFDNFAWYKSQVLKPLGMME